MRSPRGEGQLQALSKHLNHTPPVVPAVSHSDPLLTAHYHYLSLVDASGGHGKGQGTFVQRISSNFSGEKYISPAFCRAGWGRWAGSRAPCSSLLLLHLARLPHRQSCIHTASGCPGVLVLPWPAVNVCDWKGPQGCSSTAVVLGGCRCCVCRAGESPAQPQCSPQQPNRHGRLPDPAGPAPGWSQVATQGLIWEDLC